MGTSWIIYDFPLHLNFICPCRKCIQPSTFHWLNNSDDLWTDLALRSHVGLDNPAPSVNLKYKHIKIGQFWLCADFRRNPFQIKCPVSESRNIPISSHRMMTLSALWRFVRLNYWPLLDEVSQIFRITPTFHQVLNIHSTRISIMTTTVSNIYHFTVTGQIRSQLDLRWAEGCRCA